MGKNTIRQVSLPLGGISRDTAYQEQKPFTTPYAMNIRPLETETGRHRLSTRPGLSKLSNSLGGSIQLLDEISLVGNADYCNIQSFYDDFNGEYFTEWSAIGLWTFSDSTTREWLTPNYHIDDATYTSSTGYVGVLLNTGILSSFDSSEKFTITTSVVMGNNTEIDGTYYTFFYADSAGENGYYVETNITTFEDSGEYYYRYSVILYRYTTSGGVVTLTSLDTAEYTGSSKVVNSPLYIKVECDGGDVTAYINDDETVSDTGLSEDDYVGYGLYGGAISSFLLDYVSNTTFSETPRDLLVCIAGGDLMVEADPYQFNDVTGDLAGKFRTDVKINGAQRFQLYYIADRGQRIAGLEGTVNATALDDSGVSDWTSYGIDTDTDVVFIYNTEGTELGEYDGVYEISSVSAGQVTLASSVGGSSDCAYRICRGAKIYNPAEETTPVELWKTEEYTEEEADNLGNEDLEGEPKGSVPMNCDLICVYKDRMVLAESGKHVWYMSRQGNPLDFDYSITDDVSAAIGGTTADGGEIGCIFTAIAPYSDDYMIMAGKNELWMMKGDPGYGGQIDNVSYHVGIVSARAWTHGAQGEMYFMSHDGLYMLQGRQLTKLSKNIAELENIEIPVELQYDASVNGVYINPVLNADSSSTTGYTLWYYDCDTQSVWEAEYPSAYCGRTMFYHQGLSRNICLWGGRDGFIRYHCKEARKDTTIAIDSKITIGAMKITTEGWKPGVMDRLIIALSDSSDDATYSFRTGKTADIAYNSTPHWTGGVKAGREYLSVVKAKGFYGYLDIEPNDDGHLSLEGIQWIRRGTR